MDSIMCTVVICQSFCICVTIHAVHGDGSVRGTRSAMTREEISQLRATTVFDFYQAKLALFTSREHLNLSQLREYRSSLTEVVGTVRRLCQNKHHGPLSDEVSLATFAIMPPSKYAKP